VGHLKSKTWFETTVNKPKEAQARSSQVWRSKNETQNFQEKFLGAHNLHGGAILSAEKLRMFGARYVLGDLLATGKEYVCSSASLSNLQAEIVALKEVLEFDNT
jgi:predicted lipoprotein